jgi:hypothetical protein
MTLQTSGRISLGDVQRELRDTDDISLGEDQVRYLAEDDGGLISMSQLYGKKKYQGEYVWTSYPEMGNGETIDKALPVDLNSGDRILYVLRCGNCCNCPGTNYATLTLPDQGITLIDGAIAGYWGGQGTSNWGQWRIFNVTSYIPKGATLRLTRSFDGCAMIGTSQIYMAKGYSSARNEVQLNDLRQQGWNVGVANSDVDDQEQIDHGSPTPDPRLSADQREYADFGSVYWNFGGMQQQVTASAVTTSEIRAGASCVFRGVFAKPGGNYNVTANVRIYTQEHGTLYEAAIASWYGAHGWGQQPLAGYEFTAPISIPTGTTIYCQHYTNGQYGDGTFIEFGYLDVANITP